jgi:chromosome segregation ATPase
MLSRGERPTRPGVQDLLATDQFLGRRGSHAVVQRHIDAFWADMARTLQPAARAVEGVPAEFVPILDRALAEMVEASRRMAEAGLAERQAALDARAEGMEASAREALERAAASEQARALAEAGLAAAREQASDMRAAASAWEEKLSLALSRNEALQEAIGEKYLEIRRQAEAINAAGQALERANDVYRMETRRLSMQVDAERQAARAEARALSGQADAQREAAAALRGELARAGEEIAGLRAEAGALAQSRHGLELALKSAEGRIMGLEADILRARQEADDLCRLQKTTERLEKQIRAAGGRPRKPATEAVK